MPVVDIGGISVKLSPEGERIAALCMDGLVGAAKLLLSSAQNADPRLREALSPAGLAPVFEGLIDYLQQATVVLLQAIAEAGGDDPSDRLADSKALLESLVTRYLDGVVIGLERLVKDWDSLAAVFFADDFGATRAIFAPQALTAVVPQDDAMSNGGIASLTLALRRKGGTVPLATETSGELVYVPRDLTADYTIMGETEGLCRATGAALPVASPCGHPGCASIAERVNATLADPLALPTFRVWPVTATVVSDGLESQAYGWRAQLRPDAPAEAPDPAAAESYFRTFGHYLGLAWAFGVRGDRNDFVVHRQRPVWTGLAYAFESPFPDMAATGMTTDPGPLAPDVAQAAPGFLAPSSQQDQSAVVRGCREALEALAALAAELGDRFLLGPPVFTRYRPHGQQAAQERHADVLQALSLASGWDDRGTLLRIVELWRAEADASWTQYWFATVRAAIAVDCQIVKNSSPPQIRDAVAAAKLDVEALFDGQPYDGLGTADFLSLAPGDRATAWRVLEGLARELSYYGDGTDWDAGVDSSWAALPSYALVDFEMSDHLSARLPYFVRPLQAASLFTPADSREVTLTGVVAPPAPAPRRDTYFPGAMANEIASRVGALGNAGMRARLLQQAAALLGE